ncbi:MAG: SEL1-like repeat protein [Halieaceae bacterium]|nr:SEL1-like repeat protein [Halieaceae bacterium]
MAAEQGNALAQSGLGIMYDSGEGVPEDDVQAYAWLSIAAAQGNEVAKTLKESIANDMTNAQIAEAQKLSRKYWEAYGPAR